VLLPRVIQSWQISTASRAREFARQRGQERGLKAETVECAVRFAALLQATRRIEAVKEALARANAKIESVQNSPEFLENSLQSALEVETSATLSISASEQELVDLQGRVARARGELKTLGADGVMLAALQDHELEEWALATELGGDKWEAFRAELEVQVAWLDLLGQLKRFEELVLRGASVVAGTCVGLGSSEAFGRLTFDLCIIDEASKAAPTEALYPMVRSRAVVLVGDPKQLPPFESGSLDIEEYQPEELKRTLLDHFLEHLPKTNIFALRHQQRMCETIGDMISVAFYEGKLVNKRPDEKRPAWIRRAFPQPVIWLDTKGSRQSAVGKSYINAGELRATLFMLEKLDSAVRKSKVPERVSVCVIAAYAAQAHAIESKVQKDSFPKLAIEIATVDSFQGRECDVCIFSITLSNSGNFLGFLKSANRINVALSRPRDLLVIIGDRRFVAGVSASNPFSSVVDYIDAHHSTCAVHDSPF
jgi:AAA domain